MADLNGDGYLDIIFPNGGDYDRPGTPLATWVFMNHYSEDQPFADATASVTGDFVGFTRVAKVADLEW